VDSELNFLRLKRLAAAIALGSAAVVAQPAVAQQQQQGAQQQPEEVVVTGSYIQRPADRPQPITVMSGGDLNVQQRSSVAEIFKDMPQVTGSVSTINTAEGGNSPTATINLRGLGPRATLVLLNGERQTTDGGIGAVDINNLTPPIMIKRVEVLTDGASALYGSDAVAGVVNFITRNDFQGSEVRVNLQKIKDNPNSRPDMNVDILTGAQGENTSVVAGLEYATTQTMLVENRYSDARLLDTLQSTFANPGSFTNTATGARAPDPLCGSDQIGSGGLTSGFIGPLGTSCKLANSLGRALQPESKRIVGLAELNHDLGHGVHANVEMGFARTRYKIAFGYVTPLLFPLPFVPATNPGVIAANAADPAWCNPGAGQDCLQNFLFWGRPLSPAGGEAEQNYHYTDQNTYRLALKLDGTFGSSNWDWRASAVDSYNDWSFTSIDTLSDRYTNALQGYGGPNCAFSPASDPTGAQAGVGDCEWWNPFANHLLAQPGDPNYNDPALRDWFLGGRVETRAGELRTLNFISTGKLWQMAGGQTGVALGVQHREQSFSDKWDPITHGGGWRFNSDPYQDFSGVRNTSAVFGELDMYPTQTFEIQLAARNENYGNISSTDPKIGLLWTPTKRLFFRVSAGTSFRQPGELESYGNGPGGASVREIGGDAIQARATIHGNPNLRPETSKNWTAGITWDATDHFTMDLNYWDIQFKDLITQEQADIILAQDLQDGYITDPRIVLRQGAPNRVCEHFDPTYAGGDPNCMSGFDIRVFNLSYFNQDYQDTSGVDTVFTYNFNALGGQWQAKLTGSYTGKYDMIASGQLIHGVGSFNTDNFGFPNARWRGNFALDWQKGNHHARATWRYISKLKEDDPGNPLTQERSFRTLDLFYEFSMPGGRSDLTASIVNAFDKEDPIKQNTLQTTESSIYDVRGRVFNIGYQWTIK
jgi:outer membrane receptor protein involved in Fe transport